MTALLAFDTSTERTHLALDVDGRVEVREGDGGAVASTTFLPAVLALLDGACLAVADLDAIAFGRGPGAFTGLRTACAVAQGLGFGANRPVLPIDTLLALAEDARGGAPTFRVWALLDARMNEIYAAEYAYAHRAWTTCQEPMLTTVEALQRRWEPAPPCALAGNALAVHGPRLARAGGDVRAYPDAAPRGAALAALARAAWRRGETVDAALALPLYVRDKVAQTSAERAAAGPR